MSRRALVQSPQDLVQAALCLADGNFPQLWRISEIRPRRRDNDPIVEEQSARLSRRKSRRRKTELPKVVAGDRTADRDHIAVALDVEVPNAFGSLLSQATDNGSTDGYELRSDGGGLMHGVTPVGAPRRHYFDGGPGNWLHAASLRHI